ncbi:enoyl-CoA hydratase/isomerase family protein [Ammoniphilus sp. YIM 78166]|uniref:enoyl-CoA hydratase/isomerase family protein n=1 Tax=Ammoniphilus sp. YIM 78166 TaxID=1644106 RepID=UPI00106F2D7D|nr:enoyl-CoA hydratase/isomerase family protein [Ammoniphilus sp. YIM 78166]
MSAHTLKVEIMDQLAIVTLDRPEVRNAISFEMVKELDLLLDKLDSSQEVKVIIFTGSGDQAFVSGGDLDQFLSVRGKEKALPMLTKVGSLLSKIEKLSKPTIAMINGAAIGGGCEFATACDFRFASEQARMGFVQISMHITTGWGSGSRLVKKIGRSQALSLLLTGEVIEAKRALELGFVDHVFEHTRLREKTLEFARKIAKQPLPGIQAYMNMVHDLDAGMKLEESIKLEIDRCAEMWGSDLHLGVVQAFLNKTREK